MYVGELQCIKSSCDKWEFLQFFQRPLTTCTTQTAGNLPLWLCKETVKQSKHFFPHSYLCEYGEAFPWNQGADANFFSVPLTSANFDYDLSCCCMSQCGFAVVHHGRVSCCGQISKCRTFNTFIRWVFYLSPMEYHKITWDIVSYFDWINMKNRMLPEVHDQRWNSIENMCY